MITYRLTHPQLSHPLEMDSHVERTDRALIAWATMYILREYDEMVNVRRLDGREYLTRRL